jgi:hypothetical protein
MDPRKENSGSKIKSFLRRKDDIKLENLETKTELGDHKEFIKQKLFEKPEEPIFDFNFQDFWANTQKRLLKLYKFIRSKPVLDNAPMGLFVCFSIVVLWKMEAQLDKMRNKVIVQKSIKQMEIERENEVI